MAQTRPLVRRTLSLAAIASLCGTGCEADPPLERERDYVGGDATYHPGPDPEVHIEEAELTDASGSFRVVLTLPPGEDVHAAALMVPGLGPQAAETPFGRYGRGLGYGAFHRLGLATVGFDMPGTVFDAEDDPYFEPASPTIVVDEQLYATSTPTMMRERAAAALEWALQHPRVAAGGHYVIGNELSAANATLIAAQHDVDAILWSAPIVQPMSDFLYDELHVRHWLRFGPRADTNEDGTIDAEEWGIFKGTSGALDLPALAELDLDGDGVYTPADNVLAGEAATAELPALLASSADGYALAEHNAWKAFWGDRWTRFPSPAWLEDALAAPTAIDTLATGNAPVFVLAKASIDASATSLAALDLRGVSPRIRFHWLDPSTPTSTFYVTYRCLLGLAKAPRYPELLEKLKEDEPPICGWDL